MTKTTTNKATFKASKSPEYHVKQEHSNINIYTDEVHFASRTNTPPHKVVDEWLQEKEWVQENYFDYGRVVSNKDPTQRKCKK